LRILVVKSASLTASSFEVEMARLRLITPDLRLPDLCFPDPVLSVLIRDSFRDD
jgi:hypothetical protein